jgi:Tfp pilus assembly protein PilF
VIARLRRDPGLALLVLGLVLAAALYAPTLGRGILDYDDPWLIRDNHLLRDPSWHSLQAVFFDTSTATRYGLGAEYLPVRDVSVMFDYAVWGDWYQGFHLTNLVIYLAAIAAWFAAFVRLGVARTIAGFAIVLFAVHPSHAESVAWLSERKGLLAVAWAGAAALGYARYRTGGSVRWLVLAAVAAVAAVWSKAPAAFALAALAGLELVVPAPRVSWRRSLVGLGVIGAAGALAFIPVVLVAIDMSVVAGSARAPASWLPLVIGVHGFYVQLAFMTVANAITYPIATNGPGVVDLVVGALGLVAVIAALRTRMPAALRAGAVLWLCAWFPNSRIVLPVVKVLVADRYLMFGSLGFALAVAAGVAAIGHARIRVALAVVVVAAAAARTLDAQSVWGDELSLWTRAVRSNPDDGVAWSFFADQLAVHGRQDLADAAVAEGLTHSHDAHLLHRDALFLVARGERAKGQERLREAAEGGAAYAMSNLALMLMDERNFDEAIAWARRATQAEPMYPNGHRILGKVLFTAGRVEEALPEWERAYALEPGNLANRFNLGLALVALHRMDEARPHLEACMADPRLVPRVKPLLESH